jgi:hypothetical protein
MKLYTPKNTEFFQLSASDFLTAGEGDWRAERLADGLADPDDQSERERAADELAGFYWWTCSPGCLPDSDASGPFVTETEAVEDAGGGHYEDHIFALADELGEDPADISEEKYECYGLKVLSCGRAEYAIGTDEEADEAWDQSLDSYLDDCGVLNSMPENLRRYFDREAWKSDARHNGRGHTLSSYDGEEMELNGGFVAFRIN